LRRVSLVLWPVRVALLWVLGVADPGTLAAVREAGAATVPALESWRPPFVGWLDS
jgi:hypothetical protein